MYPSLVRAVILAATAVLLLTAPGWSGLKGRAANFRGLIMGKSKHAESLRVLGAPIHAGPPEGAPQIIADNYERAGLFPFPYQRVMIFWNPRTGIVDSVEVQLTEAIPLDSLEKQFGSGWVKVTWESKDCGNAGGGSTEIYVSSKGEFSTWENLAKGFTYWPTPPSLLYAGKRTLPAKPKPCR